MKSVSRTLVTGAAGFIGSAVVRRLVDDGSDVTAAVRKTVPTKWAGEALTGAQICVIPDYLVGTVASSLLEKVRPHVVINCIGNLSTGRLGNMRPLVDANVTTTGVLLEASADAGVDRFIEVGSGFEYAPSNARLLETDPIGPTTLYGVTKAAGSALALHFKRAGDLDVCVVRPFSLYGAREQLHRFVPYAVTCALERAEIRMSAGDQTRDYLFVDDFAEGLASAAGYAGRLPDVLNFAGSETHLLGEIARLVSDITSSTALIRGDRLPNEGDRSVFLGDSSLATRVLGWYPRRSLRSGLAETVEWYISHRDLWSERQ